MAVTKKSLIDNTSSAKTTPSKATKTSAAAPISQSKMKTTMMRWG
jgi:hypothetical protein